MTCDSSQFRAPVSLNYEDLSVKLHKGNNGFGFKIRKGLMIEVSSSTKCYIITICILVVWWLIEIVQVIIQ